MQFWIKDKQHISLNLWFQRDGKSLRILMETRQTIHLQVMRLRSSIQEIAFTAEDDGEIEGIFLALPLKSIDDYNNQA